MDKFQFISKNLLIAGETGAGKTYFIKYLIDHLLKERDKKPLVFIHDLKGIDYFKVVDNSNVFAYDEDKIFALIDDRLTKIKDVKAASFQEVYVIIDELALALESYEKLIKNKSNKNRKLGHSLIDFCTSSVSKKIKVYIICATQLPNLLLPTEIQSKFNLYIDMLCDSNTRSDNLYSSLLKSKLNNAFHEILRTKFDERYLTVYQIERDENIKYIVKENDEIALVTSDYTLAHSIFLAGIKKIIRDNFGIVGTLGLPYGLEAYLCVDDEVNEDKNLLKKADDILNLFEQIQTFDGSIVHKNHLRDIRFSNEEWTFELNAKDGLANITCYDDIHYLTTNIFSNLKKTNQLYFRFHLQRVISTPKEMSKLGEEMKYEITINKID